MNTQSKGVTGMGKQACAAGDGMNAQTQHTPGPWSVASGNEGEVEVRATRKWPIAIVLTGSDDLDVLDDPETQANGRLIAAAPELLEALERAFFALGRAGGNVSSGPCRAEWEQARAALAKARGDA